MVSIVILTMGYPQRVMDSLKKQTYQDFEVVVAQEKGIVNAMNSALRRAKGDIFVRIDDDVDMPAHWLENLVEPFKDLNVVGVTGPTFVPKELRKNRDSIRWAENPTRFLRWLYDGGHFKPAGIYKCGNVSYDSNYQERFEGYSLSERFHPDHLEGTNWAMRTDLIKIVGGFDEKFDGVAEWFDTDVEQKILKWGKLVGERFRLVYNPRAYLYHLLGKGDHFGERFEGLGRIKNWLRYHSRHSKFHCKKVVFLIVWSGYFLCKKFRS